MQGMFDGLLEGLIIIGVIIFIAGIGVALGAIWLWHHLHV